MKLSCKENEMKFKFFRKISYFPAILSVHFPPFSFKKESYE